MCSKQAQNSRISDRNAFASQHAPSCESICKRKSYIPTPDPPQGRGELTCGTSPGPSQGGELKLARKLVITHFVITHYELCIMH